MRTLLLFAALACSAPACAGQLSNAKLLAQVDDASASEVRWVLQSEPVASGGVGFGGYVSRATMAWERLVRQGEASVFEAMTQSEHDVTVGWGIMGLIELDPSALSRLASELVVRRGSYEAASGCMFSTTSPAWEVLDYMRQHELVDEAAVVEQAWDAWLTDLQSEGASESDANVVYAFSTLLNSLDVDEEWISTKPYIDALCDNDISIALLKLAAVDKHSDGRDLAVSQLAWRLKDEDEHEVVRRVWSRKLEGDEWTARICALAEFWDRAVASPQKSNHSFRESRRLCWWQRLTIKDWDWLTSVEDTRLRSAAIQLRNNPIAGWRLDSDLPEDELQRKIWLQQAIIAAEDKNSMNADRARMALIAALDTDITSIPVGLRPSSISTWETSVAELLGKRNLLPVIQATIVSPDRLRFITGIRLVAAVLISDRTSTRDLTSLDTFDQFYKRLILECEKGELRWELRSLAYAISEFLGGDSKSRTEAFGEAQVAWVRECADILVNHPDDEPPPALGWKDATFGFYDGCEDPAAEIIHAIYEGAEDWLLEDDEDFDSGAGRDGPTPSSILRTTREALSRIEEKD